MKAKLQGGPAKGKVCHVPDGTEEYMVKIAEPVKFDYSTYIDPIAYRVATKTGSYRRGNETLKNGTVIFKWMGWFPN